ncbi:MAG: protein kinase [Acidobacteria bacterium]|nr:protein kinase [Acidobacteriota bacterium]
MRRELRKAKRMAAAGLAFFLAPAVVAPEARALDPTRAPTQYVQDVWTQRDGLPQNSANAILQTRDGYLWIGTEEGLVRFDGVRFTVFDKRNTPAIRNNFIMALAEDSEGALWIGTFGGGLVRLRDGAFESFGDDVTGQRIRTLYRDSKGAIWISTGGGGLSRYQNGTFTKWRVKDGLGSDRVWSVVEDGKGGILVGTYGGGLQRFENGVFSRIELGPRPESSLIRPLRADREGNIWIGTDGGGLYRLKDGVVTAFDSTNGLPNPFIRDLWVDRDGNLWIATDGAGVFRYSNGTFSPFSTRHGLSNDFTLSLFEDEEASLWIGTSGGGLFRLRDGAFTNITTRDGLASDVVRSVLESRDGSLWIGTTGGGVTRITNGEPVTLRAADGLASDLVFSLHEDDKGQIWIGTDGAGVNVLSGKTIKKLTTRDGLINDRVRTITGDRSGTLWFGTTNFLSRFANGRFESFTQDDGVPGSSIRSLIPARDGGIWIGSDGGGVAHLKDGVFTVWKTADGLSSSRVFSLFEDERGVLWAGTSGGGLNRIAGRVAVPITTKDGLYDDVVFSIVEDDAGWLWMTCNKGVFRVLRQELDDVAAKKIPAVRSSSFGTADGMRSAECNGGSPAAWKAKDGRLYFSTILGLTSIDPKRFRTNERPPPVRIEGLVVDKEGLRPENGMVIPPGGEQFEFHYTALSFLVPERVRFRYKLEGFDRNWIDAGTRRTAYYTNLPPGGYTFRVRACNNDGVWNETGATLSLTLTPFFYQTRWFLFTCVAAALLSALGAFRLRLQGLKRRERDLERLVSERTSQLEERTSALSRAQEQLEKLSNTSASVLEDPAAWARSVAREMARSIGAKEIGVWVVEGNSFVPLASSTLKTPDWALLQKAQKSDGFLREVSGSVVPVLGMTGEPRGILVVDGPDVVWGDVQKRIVSNLARHLGTALDLRSLRERLATSENQRAASRQQMHQKGIQLAAFCHTCHRVFEDGVTRCAVDGTPLDWSRLFPLVLGGRYRLLRVLGEGGMGMVLRARDERLHREVAVKVIRSEHLRDVSVRLRFEREARLIAHIQHPGVVAVFDSGELEDGSGFLVMEDLKGLNLADLIRHHGPGTPRQVALLIRQTGEALFEAHRAGVVHRDIKPPNIFLVPAPQGFQAKLLDFGIAKSSEPDSQLTRTGMIVGTPAYMAPEQVTGENVDARSDLYSFATVAYEALTGRAMVRAIDVARIFFEVLHNEPEPPSALVEGLGPDVDRVFALALKKRPDERPGDVLTWVNQAVSALADLPAPPGNTGWPDPLPLATRADGPAT